MKLGLDLECKDVIEKGRKKRENKVRVEKIKSKEEEKAMVKRRG